MNFRFTAILFVVLLLLIGGLLIATLVDDKPPADALLLGDLAGLKADADIEVVEIVRTDPGEEKLVMAKVGKDRWELREPSPGRLDASAVLKVIDALLKLKPTTSTELTNNPQLHGLDKPSLKVTLRWKPTSRIVCSTSSLTDTSTILTSSAIFWRANTSARRPADDR